MSFFPSAVQCWQCLSRPDSIATAGARAVKYLFALGLLTVVCINAARAQVVAPRLDSISAGDQAAAYGERQRQRAVAGQIDLQEHIRFRAGLADRRWLYADAPGLAGRFSPTQPTITGRIGPTLNSDGIFEPWAVWPGVIYGYRYDNPVEQPAGHEIQPTGPNSYTYGPKYDRRAPDYGPAPPPVFTPLDGPTVGPIAPQVVENSAIPKSLQDAVAAFRAQEYGQALAELNRVLDQQPDLGDAALLRVQALFALGDYEQAAIELRRALAALPEEAWGQVVHNYRLVYANGGVFSHQLRALEAHLDENPLDSRARLLLAYQYGYLGYPRQAVGELQQVVAGDRDRLVERLQIQLESRIVAPETEEQAGPRRF